LYEPRTSAELTPLAKLVATEGIARVENIFDPDRLRYLNKKVDPAFQMREALPRSYVYGNEMQDLGIFDDIFCDQMRDVMLSIIPDPVVYHCHIYEIAARQTKSHVFGSTLSGWHRDPDCAFHRADPTHISIFVYMKPVHPADGAFEFLLQDPEAALRTESPVIGVTGPAGMSFVWHRSFYHRASPNRGNVRRRVLKISIQRQAFASIHLRRKKELIAVTEKIPSDDLFMCCMFGRSAGRPDLGDWRYSVPVSQLAPTGTLAITQDTIDESIKRIEARHLAGVNSTDVAYD